MRILRISQRFYKLQLLPIYQAKDRRFPPVMASYGQLGGRAASAAPFGPVVVAGLAARGSAPRPLGLARSVALPAPGFAGVGGCPARRVPPRCGLGGRPPRVCWPLPWCWLLARGRRARRSARPVPRLGWVPLG